MVIRKSLQIPIVVKKSGVLLAGGQNDARDWPGTGIKRRLPTAHIRRQRYQVVSCCPAPRTKTSRYADMFRTLVNRRYFGTKLMHHSRRHFGPSRCQHCTRSTGRRLSHIYKAVATVFEVDLRAFFCWKLERVAYAYMHTHMHTQRHRNVLQHCNLLRGVNFRSVPKTIRKPPLAKETALRKQKINKIWRKTIFNQADGLLSPFNVAAAALGWHATEFAQTPPYWNSTSGFDFDHITTADMSFCISLRNFIQIGPPSAEKN